MKLESRLNELHAELKKLESKYNVLFISDNYHKPIIVADLESGITYYYEKQGFEEDY
jgi:bifunctional pyridoxal-dependent enzyme with beta-cystathionase and maltose regulon repressor activities